MMKELFIKRRTVFSNLFAIQLIQLVSLAEKKVVCKEGKCVVVDDGDKGDDNETDNVKNWTIPGIVISIVILILIGFCVYYQFCEGRCCGQT